MTMKTFSPQRKISHQEAREAFKRFENLFWKREPIPRVSIPARPDEDDDLVLMAYFRQQEAANGELENK